MSYLVAVKEKEIKRKIEEEREKEKKKIEYSSFLIGFTTKLDIGKTK